MIWLIVFMARVSWLIVCDYNHIRFPSPFLSFRGVLEQPPLYIQDSRLNESGDAASWQITVRNGKVTQVLNTSGEVAQAINPSGEGSPLEDYTIDGVFDFISSAMEDPSSSGLDFFVAYSPEYHRPVAVEAFTPGETFKPEELQLKFIIRLSYFAVLLPSF
jgi:hypothetical protein